MSSTCSPSTQGLRQEDSKFQASLGYIGRPVSKTKIIELSCALQIFRNPLIQMDAPKALDRAAQPVASLYLRALKGLRIVPL